MMSREEVQELSRMMLHWLARDDGMHDHVAKLVIRLLQEYEYLAPLGEKGAPCWIIRETVKPWESNDHRVVVLGRKGRFEEYGQLYHGDLVAGAEVREGDLWELLEPGTQIQGKVIPVEGE